jgi:hypothetical protein
MRTPTKIALLLASIVTATAATTRAKPPACPPGQRPTLSGCASTMPSLRTTTQPVEKAAAAGSAAPRRVAPPATDFRPDVPLARRSRALLVKEIAELESLLQKTPPQSPDRAGLVLRLANDYADLTAIAEREHTLREIETEAARDEMNRAERERARPRSTPTPQSGPRRPITL